MSLYEKIGRLIKQNKLYELCNSNSSDDSNIENIFSDLLFTNKIEFQTILSSALLNSNKIFTKNDFDEIQKLIKNCTPEGQLILIAIIEIQLTLVGNESNYIKYEGINDNIIEKNIYWVISREIHNKIHEEKKENEFSEYCHCINDQKEKYILGSEFNFKYENIDSSICKLKSTNKNIEFISIKSIFISFYNLTFEYIQKYIEINEYNKNNNYCEYSIFEYVINDYVYINNKLKFLNNDFKQSLDCFKNAFNISFSLEDLFKDIFFNAVFHNQILGFQYIHAFVSHDYNIKNSILKILNIISNQSLPLNKNISKMLNIDDLFNYKIDLTSKIIEKNEQMQICVGIHSVGKEYKIKKEDEKNNESVNEKEIIYVSGNFDNNESGKFNFIPYISNINMEKIFLDIEKNDIESIPIFQEKIFNNNYSVNNSNNSNNNINNNDSNNNINNNNNNININNININNINNINNNKEENFIKNKNEKKNNNNIETSNEQKNTKNNCNKEIKENNEILNMENKSLDEIYEYISMGNKVKNKKKNKKRNGKNKGKSKKIFTINNENDYIETDTNDDEDPIVIKFKNDINEKVIFANTITKIKPSISENWIKTISSY